MNINTAINLDEILNSNEEISSEEPIEIVNESITETAKPLEENAPLLDIDAIVTEWSYRCDSGCPDFNNLSDRFKLQEVLEEMQVELPFERMSEAPAKKAVVKKAVVKKSVIKLPYPETNAILVTGKTGLKEGLVMFFALQKEDILQKALEKLKTKSAAAIKFNTSVIKEKLMDGMEGGSEEVKQAINYFNSTAITNSTEIETFSNGLTSGLFLKQNLGDINPELMDRGNGMFESIKNHGIELVLAQGVKGISAGESDKWCPADILIYGSKSAATSALKTTMLNVEKKNSSQALNAFFHENFSLPPADKILGISLKEQEARHGKATSFRKILEGSKDYVVEKNAAQDTITKLVGACSGVTRTKGANLTPSDRIGGAADALGYIRNHKKDLDSIGISTDDLELKITEFLSYVFGKKNLSIVNNKENAKKAWKLDQTKTKQSFKFTENSDALKDLRSSIKTYKEALIVYAQSTYTKSRKSFIATLTETGFKSPQDLPVTFTAADEEKKDAMANLLLKKSGCYDVAAKLLDGIQAKAVLKIPPAFKNLIAEDKNVFLALTAFALSQGGISPTFYKLKGSKSKGTAHVNKFPGNGILTLEKGGSVDILDSPGNAGFDASFTCQVKEGRQSIDKYKVLLSFGYAGATFKIEVTELADVG